MDVGKSFSFVFQDRDWFSKLVVGGAILVIGILFFWLALVPTILAVALLAGYGVEITRRVIRGNPQALPDWENWGALIVDGLKLLGIVLVYAIPIAVSHLCLSAPIALFSEGSEGWIGAFFGSVLGLVYLVWGIVMALLVPPAVALFADSGEMADAFRFSRVLGLVRSNLGTYIVVALMAWVASLIGDMGVILCLVGWFLTMPYYVMVTGHLYGQAYVVAKSGATPAVAGP